MRKFDTLDELKSSLEIEPKNAYLAPDETGGVRIWEAQKKTPDDESISGFIEFCTAKKDLVLVNRSGFFANRLKSHRKIFKPELTGYLFYDMEGDKIYVYTSDMWRNVEVGHT